MAKTQKQNQDKFLSRLIIGFAIVLIAAIAVVVIGNKVSASYEYEDFTQVGNYQAMGSLPDDAYAVYFYSKTCGACKSIKFKTLEFATENKIDLPVYLLDSAQTSGSRTLISGPTGQSLDATPTLMIFSNDIMVQFIVGADQITDFYADVESGDFTIN